MDLPGQPSTSVPATATPAPAQPSGVPPVGTQTATPAPETVTISKADLDRYTRQEAQVRGFAQYGQVLSEIGVQSAEDLRSLVNPAVTAKKSGLDLNAILGTLTRPQPAQTTNNTAATGAVSPAPQVDVLREVDKKLAMRDYKAELGQQDQFLASTAAELAGPNASAEQRFAVMSMTKELVYDAMTPYPPTSPLYGELQPISQAKMAEIKATVASHWSKLRGEALAALGQAASGAPRAPVSGHPGQGSPTGGQTTNTREAAVAFADQYIKAQMGNVMSGA